jgi:hypothetical protein
MASESSPWLHYTLQKMFVELFLFSMAFLGLLDQTQQRMRLEKQADALVGIMDSRQLMNPTLVQCRLIRNVVQDPDTGRMPDYFDRLKRDQVGSPRTNLLNIYKCLQLCQVLHQDSTMGLSGLSAHQRAQYAELFAKL